VKSLYKLKIFVLNTITNKREYASEYNTYWENGELKGIQVYLKVVYEIEINTDNIKAEEDGVLTGIWIHKNDLSKHYDEYESWAKIVYDNLLK
jgi:predicted NUDIX family phosphoesterase